MIQRIGYDKYIESSISWIGQIPVDWGIRRLKYGVDLKNDKLLDDESLPYIGLENIESMTGKVISNQSPENQVNSESTSTSFYEGEVLFGKLRPYLAKCFVAEFDGKCTTEFLVLRPREQKLYNRYLFYLMISPPFIELINSSTYGAKMPRANWEFIGNQFIPSCGLNVQLQIVNFLDQKTAEIDALIADKEKLIILLEQQRQSMITEAVTRGLNPDVKSKPSGVEWIGEVPANWTVCKLNYRYSIELGKMLDEKRIVGDWLIPYLRNQDVQWGFIRVDDLPEMDISETERDRYTVKSGDLLVCEGGDVGRAAIWRGNDNEIGFQKALHRVRPRNREADTAEFLYFVLLAAKHSGAFSENDSKATISHLTGEKFRQYRFAFPPIDEQIEIADKLAYETKEINELIQELKESIVLLNEFRQSLIFEAVTGKIDVRQTVVGQTTV